MPITPDAYPHDPYAFAVNQCGHGMIGLALSVVGALVGVLWPVPIIVAVTYYIWVEVAQGWSWDGAEDAAFVGIGASLPPAIDAGPWQAAAVLAVGGAWMGLGALLRWEWDDPL